MAEAYKKDNFSTILIIGIMAAILFAVAIFYWLSNEKDESDVNNHKNTNSVIININIANTNSYTDTRCDPNWSSDPPGQNTCMMVVPEGFYFDGLECRYFPGSGSGCSTPPFNDELACQNICLGTTKLSDTAELQYNGTVSRTCQSNDDCEFIDRDYDLESCCPSPACSDYSSASYVAVNINAYEELGEALKGRRCDMTDCPDYSPPQCLENNNSMYKPICSEGICTKAIVAEKKN